MADVTANSTFRHHVQGDRRVVNVEISTVAMTTADSVKVPMYAIGNAIFGGWRSAPGANAVTPSFEISGTTLNITNYTTGIPFTIKCEGK